VTTDLIIKIGIAHIYLSLTGPLIALTKK
jgi:hypothetical protein